MVEYGIVLCAIGFAAGFGVCYLIIEKIGALKIKSAGEESARILEDAKTRAKSLAKEAELEMKDKLLQMKNEFDVETRETRLEFKKNQPFLENLSQTTATYVNNSPIKKKIKLKPGNKITSGDTVVTIKKTKETRSESKINV